VQEELERRVAERTRELATLLDLSAAISATLELREVLSLVLDRLRAVIDFSGATITVFEDEAQVILDYRGPLPRERLVGLRLPEGSPPAEFRRDIARRRTPLIVGDLGGEGPLVRYLAAEGMPLPPQGTQNVRGVLGVPLVARGRAFGCLTLTHTVPGYYTERHAQLVMAFAQQVAIAIENARLYEQARGRAALEERQRLARELHDSVSQALYSIALTASAAELVRDRAPERLAGLHAEMLALAEAGLAEMRALIFELRPESLEREGLVAALEKQAAAVRARHGIPVDAALGDEPDVPLAAKEALYRIAQEALHNAVKHARPRVLTLALEEVGGELRLSVADDGKGFDAGGAFPGHLGLHSMRERAEGIGAALALESAPGRGTRVVARLPLPVGP
jgi:signal transduction histidine kinase